LPAKYNFDVIIIFVHLNPESFSGKSNVMLFDDPQRLKICSKTTSNYADPLNFLKMAEKYNFGSIF